MQSSVVAAPAQPYIDSRLLALTARQPVVARSVTRVATSAPIVGVQPPGPSGGTKSSSIGRPRTNHSATPSNCPWANVLATLGGIATWRVKSAYSRVLG